MDPSRVYHGMLSRLSLVVFFLLGCSLAGGLAGGGRPEVPERFTPGLPPRDRVSAASLADRLTSARDLDGVTAGLRELYAYLGVGLYTPDGWQIQPGAETGPDDYYQYTLLSDLQAQSYLDGVLISLEAEAAALGGAGVILIDTDEPIAASDLLEILAAAVAASRDDPSLISPALIDALSLARGVDLTSPELDPETVDLDPIQEFIVAYDLLVGLPQESSGLRSQGLAAPARKGEGPCNFSGAEDIGTGVEGAGRVGGVIEEGAKRAGRAGRGLRRAAGAAGAVLTFADLLTDQAVMKGYKVDVRADPPNTHWRHTSDPYENEVVVKATITFRLPQGREIARCGRLAGYDFPDDGPVGQKFVSARWTWDKVLLRNGLYGLAVGLAQRDPNSKGEVGMRFTPNREPDPENGIVVSEVGQVEVCIALIGRGFGLGANVLNQLGYVPCGSTTVQVARHSAVSLRIGGTVDAGQGMMLTAGPTTIPLSRSDGALTGAGSLPMSIALTGLPAGCSFESSLPTNLTVEATGTDPLNFTVGGLASMEVSMSCFGVTLEQSLPPMGDGAPMTFALPAKIGETYRFTPAGYTGSIDFTLVAAK